jgi:hypothetical protein
MLVDQLLSEALGLLVAVGCGLRFLGHWFSPSLAAYALSKGMK